MLKSKSQVINGAWDLYSTIVIGKHYIKGSAKILSIDTVVDDGVN